MTQKILLVEDDLILLEMYKKKFENEGFIIHQAHNGVEALESALKNHPDLILLDLAMPVMDGMTMMEHLRKDVWGKAVPIIILTNLDPDSKIIQGVLKNKPVYYLRKINTRPLDVVKKAKEVINLFT